MIRMSNAERVYVNRTLNLKKIKYVGLDMDHTLIRYNAENFEAFAHKTILEKLVNDKGYPVIIKNQTFDFEMAIRGLVIDSRHGNILKLNRYGAIRVSYHGTRKIDYSEQQKLYKNTYIDLSDPKYKPIDTSFSLSVASTYAQLVDLKDGKESKTLPGYDILASDVLEVLDIAHKDETLKSEVRNDLSRYIIKDQKAVEGLERMKLHDKKLFILTNSDFFYTKLLLDYAINPYLKNHDSWQELFDFVITSAMKPRFFNDKLKFLKINPTDGTMMNFEEKLKPGIYQGGCANTFSEDLGLSGDEILYVGDHIYGDILRLKKDQAWRTGLVVEELDHEVAQNQKAQPLQTQIDEMMAEKEKLEDQFVARSTKTVEAHHSNGQGGLSKIQDKISELDTKIATLIHSQQTLYNHRWGRLFRAGNEESYFAHQVDRFACIYMPYLTDLLEYSPRTYFRAKRRPLAHEMN